jgi:hypothetical protein
MNWPLKPAMLPAQTSGMDFLAADQTTTCIILKMPRQPASGGGQCVFATQMMFELFNRCGDFDGGK